jgi:TP901 family phage tail tape measure protein
MAASAGAVRAGGAYVEIFAKDGAFQQAMTRVQNRLKAIGSSMSSFGSSLGLAGAAMATPMVLAARSAAQFEDTMLGLRAATTLTASQLAAARTRVMELSTELGTTPTKVGVAFQSLAKAGVSFEQVMSDAARTAVQFGKMAPELPMDVVAEQMNKAANSFGVSFREVADTISATADTTETSVAGLFAAFADVAPFAASLEQSLADTTMAIAALSKGMNVEEAGTAYKIFLQRLIAPSQEAQEAMASLGLSMRSFRDAATGNILPPDQIAAVFANASRGREQIDVQRASSEIFGDRGIKAISTFAGVGAEGFRKLKEEMGQSKSVAEKYAIVMSGLSGMFEALQGGVERLANVWTESLGPATRSTQLLFSSILNIASGLIQAFPTVSRTALNLTLSLLGIGGAVALIGKAVSIMGTALSAIPLLVRGVVGAFTTLMASPVLMTVGVIAGAIGAAIVAARSLSPEFKKASDSWLQMVGLMDKPQAKQDPAMFDDVQKAIVNIQKSISDAELQANQAMAGQLDAADKRRQAEEDRRQNAIQRGQSITESLRTPQEEFQDTVAELTRLRDEYFITEETFARGLQQAAERAAAAMEQADPEAEQRGASIGTFSSSAEGLGIGPELNKLEQPAIQTAANTAATVEALKEMAKDRQFVFAQRERPSGWPVDGAPQVAAAAPRPVMSESSLAAPAAAAGAAGLASIPSRSQAAMSAVSDVSETRSFRSSIATGLSQLLAVATEHKNIAKSQVTVLTQVQRAFERSIGLEFS